MPAFLYDRTFEGLLCALFDAYSRKDFPDVLLAAGDVLPLPAMRTHRVLTSRDRAIRVWKGLAGKLSPNALHSLAYAWLGEEEGGDIRLLRCMRKVFDSRGSPETDLGDFLAVFRLARKVNREAHRLQGFARFQKTAQGVYFAAVEPRYDLLPLLAPHFAARFPDQQWILYDVGRRYGLFCDKGAYRDITLAAGCLRQNRLEDGLLADGEKIFQTLWKSYCQALTIQERLNPKLQSRCLPRRYWPYLTEMAESAQISS
ncbi:MAG: TIGR03915 family putative DNA repair protein [Desulfovibrio sp.]|jgi:probable DNA metabolism protein|nr:TIGR03915 family putative DNA repair protein [Desulfovibrio sp.]